MAKLLVVEDDQTLRESVSDKLTFEHHHVETAENFAEATDMLILSDYDVLILDWELPDGTGIDILKQYRTRGGQAPVLMLTGKSAINDKESGFGAGADDYLTKPFLFKELVLRVDALLRRPQALIANELTFRGLVLDPKSYSLTQDGQPVKVLPQEFTLLEFLMRNVDKVFSADALLSRVWESDVDASAQAVVQCISRLRQKLEKKGERPLIATVHGVGYKLQS